MVRYFVFFIVYVGMVFIVLAVTSTSSFATDGPNVIHACIKKNNGQLRVVSEPSECLPSENPIDLQAAVEEEGCPDDMVEVGPICVDKYEALVVDSNGNPASTTACSANGNDCSDPSQPEKMIFARSVAGVLPSAGFTWFQAQQACFNMGKRLLTNAEWQGAAAGTPDDQIACNIMGSLEKTDAREATCISKWGVVNMVGNLSEWVGDWIQGNTTPFAPSSGTAGPGYGGDEMFGTNPAIVQGVNSTNFPAALVRGGRFGLDAGVFALRADLAPSLSFFSVGFRCAR